MKVSIIGTGYVGLVTGACLAEKGRQVICVDVDESKLAMIAAGTPPFHEAGLQDLLKKHIGKNLHVTSDLAGAVRSTDVTLIAVGTPLNGSEIDLSGIRLAAQQVGAALSDKPTYHLVAVKSTVVPGTTDNVVTPILEAASQKQAGADFGVGMNPEFLTEGQAVADFMQPDRFILGGCDDRSIRTLERLYSGFGETPKVRTNNTTAETIKYASNALLATMISLANEFGALCSALGTTDVVDVMKGLHLSHYLSPATRTGERITAPIASFLQAGCGFGGSCLPKDVQALVAHGAKHGVTMPVLKAVLEENSLQPHRVVALLDRHFKSLDHVNVAVLGLAFKPDTDDMRNSPAIPIINELLDRGVDCKAYDPIANRQAERVLKHPRLAFCDNLDTALRGIDAAVLVTRWSEFNRVPELLRRAKPQPLLIDGRRMFDKRSVARYDGIGL